MNELKEFYEAISKLLTDKSELIVSKPAKNGEKLAFRVVGKDKIQDYYKDYATSKAEYAQTEAQEKEYFKEFGADLKAMPEPEPVVYIPLIEDEKVGFSLWGYESEKDVPFEIRLSQEYHLFCFHYKKSKDDKTLKLFLKHRIANTESKELYWFEYKEHLNEVLENPSRKVKPVFADFLIHERRFDLAQKLTPFIINTIKGKGKHIALCMHALSNMKLINFTDRQPVYDSLNLNESRWKGANDYLNASSNSQLKETDLKTYETEIQLIIDKL